MPNHFSIIIDKSVLQSLTGRESKWLFHHFRVNMPPILFAEILGDLNKTDRKKLSTGTGIGDVRMLSSKIEAAFIDLNAEAHGLLTAELHGASFPLDGRPVLENAQRIMDPRGGYGIYVDQTPMQHVVDRWSVGDFKGMEEAFSKVWRQDLNNIQLEKVIHSTKHLRVKTIITPAAVSELVNNILFKPNQNHANLLLWMELLGIPDTWRKQVVSKWKTRRRPPASEFVPYTAYIAKLELFFYLAVAHHVVSTRATNRIDIDYFKYLPFTRIFASGDKIHSELFPVFARDNQVFIWRDDLKAALCQMADHYDGLSEKERSQGSMTYADYPPVHMDNAITKAYDQIIPRWREGANQPKAPRDPLRDKQIMERLKPMLDAIKAHERKSAR
ncbi:hypothetical protein D5400_14260 [Georhizobium profundi]|uniref:Uncharacterized protein n=1 Tax=Georhizobium profundi TaxID=2341112 RepID=A0A3S9B5T7_9HYPH|nr:hypothetical protein [Georhizobium profundi]AZN72286.1 hypothetical protein D5400_14260 [Georhizobium profundi]